MSDSHRRKSQAEEERKTTDTNVGGQVVNSVKWGRRVGQKEKLLLDLEMRSSFVTLVKAISETWWAVIFQSLMMGFVPGRTNSDT